MSFVFEAQQRADLGKGASRRLRRDGKVPAVVYGGSEAAVSVTLDFNKVNVAQQQDAFYSDVLALNIDGKEVKVKLAAMQRHPVKTHVVHLDFVRA